MKLRPSRLSLLLIAALAGGAAAQDDITTVYRCTDASGHLTLQDAPCPGGQAQQTRHMQRPVDPPPAPAPATPPTPAPEPEPAPVAVASPPSQPMYECTRPDGSRYTSDDAKGNPRWVSDGWSLRSNPLPDVPRLVDPARLQAGTLVAAAQDPGKVAPRPHFNTRPAEPPPPPPPDHGHGHGHGHHGDRWGYGYGGGHWEYDDCQVMAQADACSLLRDRREGIRKRSFNAQANERATLANEERAINARLASDCRGS